ncbi:hypothetical protein GEMRC1_005391 [Eukaryota sp. GEM-RC1]
MSYNFYAEPRAVSENDRPYRESGATPQNLMFDRRIVRGSTVNTPLFRSQIQQHFSPKKSNTHRRRKSRSRSSLPQSSSSVTISNSPPPVDGRMHNEIQTEQYLEELEDKPTEVNMALQTDPFLERPPTPIFVPQKTGLDADTQIMDGDLFDFDREVVPILDVLVSKVLEQSLSEVLEEEELDALRRRRDDYAQRLTVEQTQTERLEAMERRKREEVERRREQARLAKEKEDATARKLAICQFSRSFLQNIEVSAMNSLRRSGYFDCRLEASVEMDIMPWINEEALILIEKKEKSREMLNTLLLAALKRIPAYAGYL